MRLYATACKGLRGFILPTPRPQHSGHTIAQAGASHLWANSCFKDKQKSSNAQNTQGLLPPDVEDLLLSSDFTAWVFLAGRLAGFLCNGVVFVPCVADGVTVVVVAGCFLVELVSCFTAPVCACNAIISIKAAVVIVNFFITQISGV